MHNKFGLEWQPTKPNSSEEEARIITAIENRVSRFDRYGELLIFHNAADASIALDELSRRGITAERSDWLAVSADAAEAGERFDDFALVTETGHIYFDWAYVAFFRLIANRPEAEIAPAFMQMEEFRIASVQDAKLPRDHAQTWCAIERQLDELAERVAQAYRCDIAWLNPDRL